MRNAIGASLAVLLLPMPFASTSTEPPARQATEVRLEFLSIRWRPKHESASKDAFGFNLAVRLRLSNESDETVCYLTSLNRINPVGLEYLRRKGQKDWESPPPDRRGIGEFSSSVYEWRQLPPKSAVEAERMTGTLDGDYEVAYSAFVKNEGDSQPRVLLTQPRLLPSRPSP